MSRIVSKLAISAGAAALVFAPVAASAGTRAGDSEAVYTSSVSQPGTGRSDRGESAVGGSAFVFILIGAYIGAFTTAFITEITEDDDFFDDDDGFQSAGT